MDYMTWVKNIQEFNLPSYQDLPDIPLYSDQVLIYIQGLLVNFFGDDEPVITRAMINNYVKLKLMPAPIKKRYYKDHIAYIITITILKSVISIPNIVDGIDAVRKQYGKENAYDIFTKIVVKEIQSVLSMTTQSNIVIENQDYETDPVILPMKAASISVISKIFAEKKLKEIVRGNINE